MTTDSLRPPLPRSSSRPSLPACFAALLGGLLLALPVHAQPVTVTAPLLAGDEPAGHVKSVELKVRRWTSPSRFQFEFPVGGDDGKAALLYGTVDTSHQDSIVMGRVCSDVALQLVEKISDDFAVTMLAKTEAQLVSRSQRGTVIKVPAPVPNGLEEERLLPTSALLAQCSDETGASAPSPDLTCEPFAFHSRPDEASASFEIAAARRVAVKPDKDGWQRVEYDDFNGFRWRGFARIVPKCDQAPKAGAVTGAPGSFAGQTEPCRRALLPRGAALRAADRKTLLLAVRRDFEVRLCSTEQPFEWEVELNEAGSGEATVRGFFDGSPMPLPGPAVAQ